MLPLAQPTDLISDPIEELQSVEVVVAAAILSVTILQIMNHFLHLCVLQSLSKKRLTVKVPVVTVAATKQIVFETRAAVIEFADHDSL